MSMNAELEAVAGVVREVMINFQNSSGDTLTLNNFSLSAGQWDAQAANGVPQQGFQVDPGMGPTWGNATGTPFTGVAGSMSFGVNAVTVTVTWSWPYGSVPTANVTVTGSSTLTASVQLSNTGSSVTTATVMMSGS